MPSRSNPFVSFKYADFWYNCLLENNFIHARYGGTILLDYGFEKLGLMEIVATTVPANWRSRRVMERLGMTRLPEDDFDHPRVPDGPLKRHVLYRLRRPGADVS